MKHSRPLSLLLLLSALIPSVGAANPSAPTPAETATARSLAREGQTALIAKDFDGAAERFARAVALVDAPTLELGLARARVGQGRLVIAYEMYQSLARRQLAADASTPFIHALKSAQSELKQLEARLAWVTISVTGVSAEDSLRVALNGVPVATATIGVKVPVDPGEVVVSAEANGYESAEVSFEVSEGEDNALAELKLRKLAGASAAFGTPASAPERDAGPLPAWMPSLKTLGYISAGVGVVGMGTGGVLWYLGNQEVDSLYEGGCYDLPDGRLWCPEGLSRKAYNNYYTGTYVGMIGGGALVALGAVLYYLGDQQEAEGMAIQPYLTPQGGGLVGRF